MRRMVCMIMALLLCCGMVFPVFAAEGFVPSISYKEHPDVEGNPKLVDEDGETIEVLKDGCLVITPVSQAKTSTKIPEESRQTLLDVYEQLSDGTMKLPYKDDDMVIRDLVDASLICSNGHKEELAKEGVYIEITFDLGVGSKTDVVVMTYMDGQWAPIHSVTNNGDGTVTCVFEDICPVAFSVAESTYDEIPKTGDQVRAMILWVVLLVVSAVAIVVLVILRKKKK